MNLMKSGEEMVKFWFPLYRRRMEKKPLVPASPSLFERLVERTVVDFDRVKIDSVDLYSERIENLTVQESQYVISLADCSIGECVLVCFRDYIYHNYEKSISHSHIIEGTSRTLPYTIRFVGLLGSHSLGKNPKFMATAIDLGRELIRRRISLAYGGGNVGLQGTVALTVFNNGGLVRGFISGYTEHTVSSNYYKYFEMNHAVEAFIVLPRGVDTMEGLFTLISWASEGLHNRPIGLLNIDGYFNNLIKFLDDAVRQNFMSLSQGKLFISSFFVGELLDKLEFAKAFPGPGISYDEFVNPGRLDLELHLYHSSCNSSCILCCNDIIHKYSPRLYG
ncbi:hypothetical protein DM860_007225 [Cuscuta australis]|uniref:cytokinin riboside 5'-monophosphate phosphoribohydrolase n=1 Tax=Cuscuta australis TaxID=267555 RepID=A0A328E6U2_9ASTE|nr:hypothetical protein DM860_007225 [Cuscuta australis]